MASHHRGHGRAVDDSDHALPLDTARECFALLVAGPQPLSVDGRLFRGLPHRAVPLDELRDLLLVPGCLRLTRDAVWTHLIRRSRREGAAWTLGCAGMALPALGGMARRLCDGFPGDEFDIQAEVLSGFLGALVSIDVARPRVFPRLRWASYRQGLAALMDARNAPTPVAPGYRSTVPRPPWGHPDLVLARAVRESVLTRAEADLIGATRLDDVTVAEWAVEHRISANAAYKVRRRAEARLITFLRDEAEDAPSSDPVAVAVLGALPCDSVLPARRNAVAVLTDSAPRAAGWRRSRQLRETSPSSVAKNGGNSGLLECGESIPASTSEVC